MLVGLVSVKGAPGVTSAAVAIAAVSEGVMVELDPSGGSIDCWLRGTGEPSLFPTASALRRQADATDLLGFATSVVPGLHVIRAPTSGPLAESTIAAMTDRLVPTLSAVDTTVVIDGGRWARTQPTARRIDGCNVAALVCPPTIEGVEAVRAQIEHIEQVVDRVVVVVVGDRPYTAEEVADATHVPTASLAWDRRGLAQLLDGGITRGWSRSALARSARAVMSKLLTDEAVAPTDRALRSVALPEPAADQGVAGA